MNRLPDLRRVAGPQPEFRPVADPAAIVRGPGVRFTILTPHLLRLEYDPDEAFEDRPSQAFWYRQQPVPPFDVRRTGDQIEVETAALRLVCRPEPRGLSRKSLSVQLLDTGAVWRPGDLDRQNLGGTVRTLDGADGAVRLEPGLVSRTGWAVVDDSDSLVFDDGGWLVPRASDGSPARADLYFFGYGQDYLGCLRDYTRIAGPAPLVPRWLLGNWWSRYWPYSQEELQALVQAFRDHEVPLSVLVVDMDWHITESDTSSGWTGYTWNQDLFPEPEALLAWLHDQGLRVTLNLHPAEGVHPHEAQYEAMAARLGIDPETDQPVNFDITDPAFVQAYFELLHHPLEAQGVDFWWLDWQQGQRSRLLGLDPLWWLNHLHFYDAARPGRGRPIIFSRWGGLGNHRYPIGFSGDTIVSWDSLAFQPYFTATAANVGYGWWSHDIGGHMDGIEDPELYLRWVQFGALSPVLRLHSTNNPYHERHPWGYDATVLQLARQAMQFRHALVPYLYALAWDALQQGRTLTLPAYHLHPGDESAYHCPAQYYLGPDLIAAPFTAPCDEDTRLSRQPIWLPEVPGEDGRWYVVLDGAHLRAGAPYHGGGWHTLYGALEDVPLFARSGAMLPLGPRLAWGGLENPSELELHAFAGGDGHFDLYEDDGQTNAYLDGVYALTRFSQSWHGDRLELGIEPARGDLAVVPQARTYRISVYGVVAPAAVTLSVDALSLPVAAEHDHETGILRLGPMTMGPSQAAVLSLDGGGQPLLWRADRRAGAVRRVLRALRLDNAVKREIDAALPDLLAGRASLDHYATHLTDGQRAALESAMAH